jgi:maltooligosyltrehalose trehalohydrolase
VHRFTLWAPRAARVDLVLPARGEEVEMSPDQTMPADRPGWWAVEVEAAGPGTDYLFRLDGGTPRPDPRSPWQPAGVEGPSRVVDHSSFGWGDDSWRGVHLPSAVLYELHVGTFTPEGTFDAAASRLAHLADLGIDAVELMPVAEASGERGWGYDGVDWYAPSHCYGGPDGLKRFVDAAHAAGIGVVMDVVYNHLGPVGNYLAELGPYFTDRYRTSWGEALNFDGPYSDEVRRLVMDNATMWLRDYHCDGLRLDAVHAIYDNSALNVLEQLAAEVRRLAAALGRPKFLVAESDLDDPRLVRPRLAGGYGLDSAWADGFHHALHASLTGEQGGYYADYGRLEQLATALRRAWVYAGEWSPYRRRHHGRSPLGLSGDRFVVFSQNHDQVGNRARGERLCHLVSPGRAKIAAALVLLSPFVPLLFQGEEWAASSPFCYFADHRDPELARAVRQGRQAELAQFGWRPEQVPDPQAASTFERSQLDWSELDDPLHSAMLDWYRSLIRLRRELGIPGGDPAATTTACDGEEGWLVVERPGLLVAANLGSGPVALELDASETDLLAASEDAVTLAGSAVVLPPDSVAVLGAR